MQHSIVTMVTIECCVHCQLPLPPPFQVFKMLVAIGYCSKCKRKVGEKFSEFLALVVCGEFVKITGEKIVMTVYVTQ